MTHYTPGSPIALAASMPWGQIEITYPDGQTIIRPVIGYAGISPVILDPEGNPVEMDVQRYHAEHDPCDVCAHLESGEVVALNARLAEAWEEQTRLTEQAREWSVRWQGEAERLRAGIEALCEEWRNDAWLVNNALRGRVSQDVRVLSACAARLDALLAPPDAQEGTQEARTGVVGVGVPSGTPEGRSGAEGGA